MLGCFLFSEDDVRKKIKVLSGGEKSRVALAKTLISEANFLILDEPTNHLDFQSENILIQALQQYKGSFIIVSHNRHFITQTANKIWFIENLQVKEYPGTYPEFEYWYSRRNNTGQQVDPNGSNEKENVAKQQDRRKPKWKVAQHALKTEKEKLKRLEAKIRELENKVNNLETRLGTSEVYANSDALKETNDEYINTKKQVEQLMEQWEVMSEKLGD